MTYNPLIPYSLVPDIETLQAWIAEGHRQAVKVREKYEALYESSSNSTDAEQARHDVQVAILKVQQWAEMQKQVAALLRTAQQ